MTKVLDVRTHSSNRYRWKPGIYAGVAAAIVILLAGRAARADLIAYWNFNTLVNNANNGTSYTADVGTGGITLVGWTDEGIDATDGTLFNAIPPDPAGVALELKRDENNGGMMIISTDLTNFEDPVLSFADKRNGSGFDDVQISWSTDGVTYTDFGPGYDPGNGDFEVHSADFTSINALDGASTVYFKFTFEGATAVGGHYRVDNIQINGTSTTAIPEPSGACILAALAALGLPGWWQRRRKRKPMS